VLFAAVHESANWGTSRVLADVRLEAAKWAKTDIDQAAVTGCDFREYTP